MKTRHNGEFTYEQERDGCVVGSCEVDVHYTVAWATQEIEIISAIHNSEYGEDDYLETYETLSERYPECFIRRALRDMQANALPGSQQWIADRVRAASVAA